MGVGYQNVFVDETWSRSGDFYLSIGHVNLTLGPRLIQHGQTEATMTIDFLPPSNLKSCAPGRSTSRRSRRCT